MKYKDLDNEPWIVALEGSSPLVARWNATHGCWHWSDKVYKAKAFSTREKAEECIKRDPWLRELIQTSVPVTERSRVVPARVKMIMVFDN